MQLVPLDFLRGHDQIRYMSAQLSRTLPNWITFPQKLREAIPSFEPCGGRVLQLDSIDAGASHSEWTGRRVAVKLRACETGKLEGVFDIWIDMNINAAEALAEVLLDAAARAKQ